ncbi:MAG: NTP transferase domain-containing protein, partial [Terriglobales bacterium]
MRSPSPRPQRPVPATALLVLAAGRGTRLRSALPKVLHHAGGRSLLAHVMAAGAAAGMAPADTCVVAGFAADQVQAALAGSGVRLVVQQPQQGTGHALQVAAPDLVHYSQLIVLHGDMPLVTATTIRRLRAALEAGADAALATATPATPRAYGRIVRDLQQPERVVAIVEDRQASDAQKQIRELNAGFY